MIDSEAEVIVEVKNGVVVNVTNSHPEYVLVKVRDYDIEDVAEDEYPMLPEDENGEKYREDEW